MHLYIYMHIYGCVYTCIHTQVICVYAPLFLVLKEHRVKSGICTDCHERVFVFMCLFDCLFVCVILGGSLFV